MLSAAKIHKQVLAKLELTLSLSMLMSLTIS